GSALQHVLPAVVVQGDPQFAHVVGWRVGAADEHGLVVVAQHVVGDGDQVGPVGDVQEPVVDLEFAAEVFGQVTVEYCAVAELVVVDPHVGGAADRDSVALGVPVPFGAGRGIPLGAAVLGGFEDDVADDHVVDAVHHDLGADECGVVAQADEGRVGADFDDDLVALVAVGAFPRFFEGAGRFLVPAQDFGVVGSEVGVEVVFRVGVVVAGELVAVLVGVGVDAPLEEDDLGCVVGAASGQCLAQFGVGRDNVDVFGVGRSAAGGTAVVGGPAVVGGEHFAGDLFGFGGDPGVVVRLSQRAAGCRQGERQREGHAEGGSSSHRTLLVTRLTAGER